MSVRAHCVPLIPTFGLPRNSKHAALRKRVAALRPNWPSISRPRGNGRAQGYLRIAIQTAKKRLAYNDALAVLDRAMMLAANLPEDARAAAEAEFLEGRASIFTAS